MKRTLTALAIFLVSCGYSPEDNDTVEYGCPDCTTGKPQVTEPRDPEPRDPEPKVTVEVDIKNNVNQNDCCDNDCCDKDCCPDRQDCPTPIPSRCGEVSDDCECSCDPDASVCRRICTNPTQNTNQQTTVTQSCPPGTINCNNNSNNINISR